jgi:signal transduction histidine kinase
MPGGPARSRASAADIPAMNVAQAMQRTGLNRSTPRADKCYSEARLPEIALAAIIGGCILVGILLLLEIATDWDDFLHILTVAALVGIVVIALASRRWLQTHRAEPGSLAGLTRAVAVAETANLAKSRYLANVSHEIRSPLNAIYGYAQLVERDGVGAQEAARVIRRCSEHLTSLVEGLLDISQVENGMLRVRIEIVHLGPFLEQIVAMMRPAAAAKGLDLVYEPSALLPVLVRMDQSRFRQVLINLLSNAIKFTDHGRITLRVSYSGQTATFEIIDTGPGIAAADLERIFDPFERGGDADQHHRPGAGLGLVISRSIIDILGGKLELESTPGAGSCFRVMLMLGEVTGKLAPEARQSRVSGYEGRHRSILIVEDDFEQRTFLDRLLVALGFTVVAVSSGETALELYGEGGFDLAILDISLPGMSGWEAAARLRERVGEDIRIVMLSANVQELHRPDSRSPAHDHFLVKPIGFETLTRAIGGLLNLCWRYEGDESEARPAPLAERDGCRLPEAALAHVGRIRELLRIGHVRGIEAEIRQLAETTPQAIDLADQLYVCLDRFDLAGMERTLERS